MFLLRVFVRLGMGMCAYVGVCTVYMELIFLGGQ